MGVHVCMWYVCVCMGGAVGECGCVSVLGVVYVCFLGFPLL